MNTNSAFYIGRGHLICQDYVISGQSDDACYVILADGCSSSPDTDIGARFLVKAAESFIYQIQVGAKALPSLERYHQQSVQFASLSSKFLKLDPSCLDATLLTIKADKNGFVASCYGDGVIALARKTGFLEIYSVEFDDGYPQYVSYTMDALRRQGFDAQTTNHKSVTHVTIPQVRPSGGVTRSNEVIEFHFGNKSDYLFAAVLSDGVHSFVEYDKEDPGRVSHAVSMQEVVAQILAFSSTRGDFVSRRMSAFYQICTSRLWHHDDDLSVGVIALG